MVHDLSYAAPQLMRDLAEQGWQLTREPARTDTSLWRRDLMATSPDLRLTLRSIREDSTPQTYVLTGWRGAAKDSGCWRLAAEAPVPVAITAAIRAARPNAGPRSKLSILLRGSGWHIDSWRVNGDVGAITYTSPKGTLPVAATFLTPAAGAQPSWQIRMPYLNAATASCDIPAAVLSAFLLATAAGR